MLNAHSLSCISTKKKKKRKITITPTFIFADYHWHTQFLLQWSIFFRNYYSFSLLSHSRLLSLTLTFYNRLKNTHSLKKIKRYTQSTGTADGWKKLFEPPTKVGLIIRVLKKISPFRFFYFVWNFVLLRSPRVSRSSFITTIIRSTNSY